MQSVLQIFLPTVSFKYVHNCAIISNVLFVFAHRYILLSSRVPRLVPFQNEW